MIVNTAATKAANKNAILSIGVIGAGTMGRGIVQLFAQAGHSVRLFDVAEGAVDAALANVSAMIEKMVAKGKLEASAGTAAIAALKPCVVIEDLAGCDVVIEAIVEIMAVKQTVFKQLEGIVSANTLLASNTSSLTISELSSVCEHPERVAGLHFFNPVPLMRVVEIISSVRTSAATVASLQALVEGAGHRPVVAEDQPGFLVNHAGRGFYTEGLRIIEERVGSVADVDNVLREAMGFKMGPFELLDLTGLDVSGKVMESIHEQFFQEPFFRPSPIVAPRVAAGLLGRKTGMGWYEYKAGKKCLPEEPPAVAAPDDVSIWIDPDATGGEQLRALFSSAGATIIDADDGACILVIQPWGLDTTYACAASDLDPRRTVAIDPMPLLSGRKTIMGSPIVDAKCMGAISALLAADGSAVTLIKDSPGFIAQRVLAMIVNIGANIAQRGIASVTDLEAAVRLGLGYPKGPLTWGDDIGGENILAILDGLYECSQDPRYRPVLWLRRRVQLGVSLLTE